MERYTSTPFFTIYTFCNLPDSVVIVFSKNAEHLCRRPHPGPEYVIFCRYNATLRPIYPATHRRTVMIVNIVTILVSDHPPSSK